MKFRHSISLLIPFVFLLNLTISGQTGQVKLVTKPQDKSYERKHITEMKPIEYPYLRESDVFWEKRIWRQIDFNEKMNHPLYFPENPQGRWKSLMRVLWDAILNGEITAYDASGNTDNFEEMVPIPASQLKAKLTTTKYIRQPDPNNPDNWITQAIQSEFDPQDIKLLWIKEDWIFDKQRSEMQVRIIGICPVMEELDPTTLAFRGYNLLFWLYYPEIRPLLARSEAFNPRNSAHRLTFDQLFMQRRFSSIIIKEDNVYDRRIDDYATGIDALLESERIKNQIRQFEEELWVY